MDFLAKQGINPRAAAAAIGSFNHFKSILPNKRFLSLVDFTLPVTAERLFVIDLENGRIERYFVAHGAGSGEEWVERTSNSLEREYHSGNSRSPSGSHRSPIGPIKVREDLEEPTTGHSLKLIGLANGNRSISERHIYIHGRTTASHGKLFANGVRLSDGCFTIDPKYTEHVISELSGGSLLYVYWDEDEVNRNKEN